MIWNLGCLESLLEITTALHASTKVTVQFNGSRLRNLDFSRCVKQVCLHALFNIFQTLLKFACLAVLVSCCTSAPSGASSFFTAVVPSQMFVERWCADFYMRLSPLQFSVNGRHAGTTCLELLVPSSTYQSVRERQCYSVTATALPKLFMIEYHLWVAYCHHLPPCSRKTQSTNLYHSIKRLENQIWYKCDMN